MPWFVPGVLGNLFGGYATRLYPAEKRQPFEKARGMIHLDETTCNYCGACSKRCPASAITVDRQEKVWMLEEFRCIVCEACIEVCPRKSIVLDSQYRFPAYVKGTEVHRGVVVAKKAASADECADEPVA